MTLGSPLLSAIPGLRHAFFSREGGVSEGIYAGLNGGLGSRDDPAKVAEMLDAQPICCALTQDDLMQCYLKADIGVRGKCVRCKKINIGAPFKTTNAAGIKDHKHMCFWCVVHNLRKQKG